MTEHLLGPNPRDNRTAIERKTLGLVDYQLPLTLTRDTGFSLTVYFRRAADRAAFRADAEFAGFATRETA